MPYPRLDLFPFLPISFFLILALINRKSLKGKRVEEHYGRLGPTLHSVGTAGLPPSSFNITNGQTLLSIQKFDSQKIGARSIDLSRKAPPPILFQTLVFSLIFVLEKPHEITAIAMQSSPKTPKSGAMATSTPCAPSKSTKSKDLLSSVQIIE